MSDNNYFTQNLDHHSRIKYYWILQVISIPLLVVSLFSIWLDKHLKNDKHLQSTHSILGLFTTCFTCASITFGIFTKFFDKLKSSLIIKSIITMNSIVFYILGVVSIITGIFTHWFEEGIDSTIQKLLLCILTSIIPFVVYKSILKFIVRLL